VDVRPALVCKWPSPTPPRCALVEGVEADVGAGVGELAVEAAGAA
jgi:hypothetical protein